MKSFLIIRLDYLDVPLRNVGVGIRHGLESTRLRSRPMARQPAWTATHVGARPAPDYFGTMLADRRLSVVASSRERSHSALGADNGTKSAERSSQRVQARLLRLLDNFASRLDVRVEI